jgi:hypothetical protein
MCKIKICSNLHLAIRHESYSSCDELKLGMHNSVYGKPYESAVITFRGIGIAPLQNDSWHLSQLGSYFSAALLSILSAKQQVHF